MSDSPQQYLKDIISADEAYLTNFNTDLLIGNFRITDFLGIPQNLAELIAGPILHIMIDNAKDNGVPEAKQLTEIINNPPKCIEDQDVYNGLQYFTTVEGPWSIDFLNDTFVGQYIKIPPGTREYFQQMSRIPRCP